VVVVIATTMVVVMVTMIKDHGIENEGDEMDDETKLNKFN